MGMVQKLCLSEMTRKFTSTIVHFKLSLTGSCWKENVQNDDIPYLSNLKNSI